VIRFVSPSLAFLCLAVASAAPALAHAGHDEDVGTRWGAWGLIVMGVLFCALALVPPRPQELEREGGFALLRMLQARIEKELTGWRRLQWPVLGLFFIALGVATLAGWR